MSLNISHIPAEIKSYDIHKKRKKGRGNFFIRERNRDKRLKGL
jgi:hypothetical protein